MRLIQIRSETTKGGGPLRRKQTGNDHDYRKEREQAVLLKLVNWLTGLCRQKLLAGMRFIMPMSARSVLTRSKLLLALMSKVTA